MFGSPDYDVCAFGAHPDDIEIACGGTMAKLADKHYKVAMITLTKGEMGSRGSQDLRAQEFAAAAKILGASFYKSLELPDGRIFNSDENRLKIVQQIRELRPRIVFNHHWEARHPDHREASEVVKDAVFMAGLNQLDTGQKPWRPYKVIFYANRYEFTPSFVVDVSAWFDKKMASLYAYSSQFHDPQKTRASEPETAISHPLFLQNIETRARQYGTYLGVEYGEPFLVREPLNIEDPVTLFDERNWVAIP
ncbi:MAG: bacillithiol biosynthesis deacetylase BshB1 [Deferribacteres bacterium]|nr:bacillithiol biosynthesis deacetylase BshB1 [candidate division KSB1 bacterium]MCB9503958.1 bacillithiol biosynthesis deacetylase BshB1 [Deferribacteres bacterium]